MYFKIIFTVQVSASVLTDENIDGYSRKLKLYINLSESKMTWTKLQIISSIFCNLVPQIFGPGVQKKTEPIKLLYC